MYLVPLAQSMPRLLAEIPVDLLVYGGILLLTLLGPLLQRKKKDDGEAGEGQRARPRGRTAPPPLPPRPRDEPARTARPTGTIETLPARPEPPPARPAPPPGMLPSRPEPLRGRVPELSARPVPRPVPSAEQRRTLDEVLREIPARRERSPLEDRPGLAPVPRRPRVVVPLPPDPDDIYDVQVVEASPIGATTGEAGIRTPAEAASAARPAARPSPATLRPDPAAELRARLRVMLANRADLRAGFVLHEVLGPPLGLRE